jgi:hypothetical protein
LSGKNRGHLTPCSPHRARARYRFLGWTPLKASVLGSRLFCYWQSLFNQQRPKLDNENENDSEKTKEAAVRAIGAQSDLLLDRVFGVDSLSFVAVAVLSE